MAKFVQTTLMDSYAGSPHITEAQLGLAHQATFGPDDYVLEGGRESEAQVLTNNSIRIFDAVYCIQGRRDVIPASGYTDVTIANGTQGMNRNDIIVRRYKKNESSEIESTEYAVIKGTPNAGTAVDPEVTTGDIRSGATLHEMALYRVKITGLNITAVEPMFNILKNMASLQKELAELNSKMELQRTMACTKVVQGTGQPYVILESFESVQKKEGLLTPKSTSDVVISCMNGDWNARPLQVVSVMWQGPNCLAMFNGNIGSGEQVRINYTITVSD